jgi:ASC-1-like (ASCH) protein
VVAHRHHYVPKCYLNSFAVENPVKKKPDMLVFDAISRKCFRTSPDNVALEKDFNTINLKGHAPDAFENAMASVESDIGPALTRIIAQLSLDEEDDKAYLLNLIGLLYVRNPRSRQTRSSMYDGRLKEYMGDALSSREKWESHVKLATAAGIELPDYETAKELYKPEDVKVVVPNEAQITSEMNTFDEVLPRLFERKWAIVKAPSGSAGFVTCDHPVCLTWSEPEGKSIAPGLKLKGTEILFALSTELAVLGAFELEDGVRDLTEEEVAAANGTIALNAHRQVYSTGYEFRYRIGQSKSRLGTCLVEDDQFKGHAGS